MGLTKKNMLGLKEEGRLGKGAKLQRKTPEDYHRMGTLETFYFSASYLLLKRISGNLYSKEEKRGEKNLSKEKLLKYRKILF